MDDLKSMLDRLDADLVELKLQYDLFFQGGRRGEPTKERKDIETRILALSRRSIINSSDQLRFSNIQGRYWSFVNLWARIVRDLEEGRLRRDKTGGLTRQGTERIPAGGPAAPAPFDGGHIDRAAQELLEARRSCGLGGDPAELAALRETLQSRAKEISASSGGKKVEFRVSVEDGKPKVKATLS
ncbi:MAG: hypothetical protein IH611_05770 [Deltaproteobacteria bacterium]|nr:hypothetical protein [Deltaproteobacteria bacterium]